MRSLKNENVISEKSVNTTVVLCARECGIE